MVVDKTMQQKAKKKSVEIEATLARTQIQKAPF